MATSLTSLLAKVSALVAGGVTLSTATSPTEADVISWVNDAIQDICRIVPNNLLYTLLRKYTPSLSSGDYSFPVVSVSPAFLQFSHATYNADGKTLDVPMRKVTPQFGTLVTTNPLIADYDNPIVYFLDDNINFYPPVTASLSISASTNIVSLYYLQVPDTLSVSSDPSPLPVDFDDAIVQYVCARYYQQQEVADMTALHSGAYLNILSSIVTRKA